jgi:hypothetical protein
VSQPGDADPVPHAEVVAGFCADLDHLADHLVAGCHCGTVYR